MNQSILYLLLSLMAGMMIPFQTAMNAQLGKSLHSPYYSAVTVFVVAFIGLVLYILSARYSFPGIQAYQSAPWWSYLGGILGGAYILLIVICSPRLGIGTVTTLVLLGQVVSALLIDSTGLMKTVVHPLNWQRVAGVLLVAAGVYLVKKF